MSDDPAPLIPSPRRLGAGPPPGADARPGGEGLPSLAEARSQAPEAKWFRLGEESWAMIVAEYEAGATAKQLALKWGVSPGSVYRHVGAAGCTKARRGEAIDREAVSRFAARGADAQAQALAAAEAQAREREARQLEADPQDAADTLVRRAAARSLAGRTDEALALLKTAEALRQAAETLAPYEEVAQEEPPPANNDWLWEPEYAPKLARLARNLGIASDEKAAAAELLAEAEARKLQLSARP